MKIIEKFRSTLLHNRFGNCGRNVRFERPSILHGTHFIHIGSDNIFRRGVHLTVWPEHCRQGSTPLLSIGSGCSFGEYNNISAVDHITIGDGFLSGKWVTITDNSHGDTSVSTLRIPPRQREVVSKGPVSIGRNVWAGDKVTILPGVRIGDGVVIGANSVVTKDIPPYCVVCGSPARIIKQYDDAE